MGGNSTAGSGSAFSSRLTHNPSGRSAVARHHADFNLPSHVAGGSRPKLRSRRKQTDPSFLARKERRRGAAPTNVTNVDTSQWTIGRLASEVERLSQGNCTLYDTYPGPNLKTRIADLPIIYPFERCRLMARLAPLNATQLRFIQADAMLDYVNSYYDPIDDVASLRPFRNSSDLIDQLARLFRGRESVCMGVYPFAAYEVVEQWLAKLEAPRLYPDVLYVHAAQAAALPAPPWHATEPEYSGSDSGNCGALAAGMSLALWGGLTALIMKLTRHDWGPRLQQALDLTGCPIPCCNLRETEDEEEDTIVREFLGQYGCRLPDCDPDSLDPEAVSDSDPERPVASSSSSEQAVKGESGAEAANTRKTTNAPVNETTITATPPVPQEESIVTMTDLDD